MNCINLSPCEGCENVSIENLGNNNPMFYINEGALYKGIDSKIKYGENKITYNQIASIFLSQLEPLQGSSFELMDRGEIQIGYYKIYTVYYVELGAYIKLFDSFYRVENIKNWNNSYFELVLYELRNITI